MRRPDWIERLWSTLEGAKNRPFFYGACVELTVECIDAITGSAWLETVKPLYADEAAARALLSSEGGLERLVSDRLQAQPVPLGLVRRGDIVLLELESGPALGVSVGSRVACAGAPKGVTYLNLERALKGWRID